MLTPVGIIPHMRVPSFSKGGPLMQVMSLGEALETHFQTEALFCTFYVEGEPVWPRLRKHGPDLKMVRDAGGRVFVSMLVFDYDRPKVDREKQPWKDAEGPVEVLSKVLDAGLQPTAFYATVNGARIIFVLDRALEVDEAEAAYSVMLKRLEAAGVTSDDATADWTHYFVLPWVVKESSGPTWANPAIFVETWPGIKLKADFALKGDAPPLPTYAGDAPDPESCDGIMQVLDGKKLIQTGFARRAKAALKDTVDYDLLFRDVEPSWSPGTRNSNMWRMIGRVVARMQRAVEDLEPEQVFAMFRPMAEKMPPSADGTDYVDVAWDMVTRTFEKFAEDQAAEKATFDEKVGKMLEGFNHQCITSEASLRKLSESRGLSPIDYMREHLIAACRDEIYLMRPDGYFASEPVSKIAIHGAIKHMGLEDVYGIQDRAGQLVSRDDILKNRAFSIGRIRLELGLDRAEIRDIGTESPFLVLPSYHLIDEEPEFIPMVDTYLRVLAGDDYDRLVDWLAWAQVIEKPICALSICGPTGAGKSFLAELLGKRFGPGEKNGMKVFQDNNSGLVKNPIIHLDEGITQFKNAQAVDELFRTYVTGGTISISEKYEVTKSAEVYPRLMITSNSSEALRQAVAGRDLDDASVEALTFRVLHLDIGRNGASWLSEHGGRSMTDNWIGGERLALRHLSYLHANRPKASRWSGQGRLLVEGDRSSQTLEEMRWSTPEIEVAMRAIIKSVATGGSKVSAACFDANYGGSILVNASGLHAMIQATMESESRGMTLRKTQMAIARLTVPRTEDVRLDDGTGALRRWKLVDPEKLVKFALQYGISCPVLFERYEAHYGADRLNRLARSETKGEK